MKEENYDDRLHRIVGYLTSIITAGAGDIC